MKTFRVCCLIVGLALAAAASPAAAADLVVVASTAADIAPGAVVKSDAALKISAGASVTLISAAGKTITLKGPHAGPPGGGDGGANPTLISSLSGLLAGSGKDTAAVGTMRAMAPAQPPTDPWAIDVDHSGDRCVRHVGAVTLWRGRGEHARMVSLINLKDNREIEAEWAAGADTMGWPSQLPLADDGRYLVRIKGRSSAAKITLHRLPADLPTDAHRAAWMADHGCRSQALRLLATIK